MKALIVIPCMAISFSCNQNTSNQKNINQSNHVDLKISDNPDIFGIWTMCATSGIGIMIQMNTCNTVVFNSNGTGSIENNSVIAENFVWALKNPGMTITYKNNNSNFTFSDTFYYADFSKKDNRINLILTHNDYSYYLSK